MAFCVKCGAQIPEGNNFCANCGAQVQQPAPSALPSNPQQTPVQNQPTPPRPPQGTPEPGKQGILTTEERKQTRSQMIIEIFLAIGGLIGSISLLNLYYANIRTFGEVKSDLLLVSGLAFLLFCALIVDSINKYNSLAEDRIGRGE